MRRAGVLPSLLVALVVCLASALPAGSEVSAAARPGYRTLLEWESGSGSATGVVFFRASEDRLTRRLLVETPEGRRLVLTKRLLVQEGQDRYELVDDETGWWVRLVKDYEFEVETLDEFFSRWEELLKPGEGREVEMELLTSQGLHFIATVPVAQQGETETAAFAKLLLESDAGTELRQEMPEEIWRGIAFLEVAFEPAASSLRALPQVLAEVVDPEVRKAASHATWKQTEEKLRYRLAPESQEEARFVARFLSVDPTDPLKQEAAGDDTRVRLRSRHVLEDVRRLAELEEILAPAGFVRIHRSYLVNPGRVLELRRRDGAEGYEVVLEPPVNRVLPVSAGRLDALRERFRQVGGGRRFHFADPNGNELAVWSDG